MLRRVQSVYELEFVTDDMDPVFTREDDSPEFTMDRDTWVDMGRPGIITVTVVPGDLLNDPFNERDDEDDELPTYELHEDHGDLLDDPFSERDDEDDGLPTYELYEDHGYPRI